MGSGLEGLHVPEVERLPEVIDAVDETSPLGRGRRVRIVAALYHRLRARVHGRLVSVVSRVSTVSRASTEHVAGVSIVITTGVVSVVSISVASVVSIVSKVGCASRKTGALSPILESCVMRAVSSSGDEVGS